MKECCTLQLFFVFFVLFASIYLYAYTVHTHIFVDSAVLGIALVCCMSAVGK